MLQASDDVSNNNFRNIEAVRGAAKTLGNTNDVETDVDEILGKRLSSVGTRGRGGRTNGTSGTGRGKAGRRAGSRNK